MARYTGPVCRLCRREEYEALPQGRALLHRQVRLRAPRSTRPGQHGQSAPPQALRLRRAAAREAEGQAYLRHRRASVPRLLLHKATRMKGVTGENLIQLLERRLDNAVYRMGFVCDHAEGRRQLVRHGHFLVNGKRSTSPRTWFARRRCGRGQRKVRKITALSRLSAWPSSGAASRSGSSLDKDAFKGHRPRLPATRRLSPLPIREQLIIELYSK